MCSILAIGNYFWETNTGSHFTEFLPRQDSNDASLSAFLTFWSYVIILNTVVPISLYVRYSMNLETLMKVGLGCKCLPPLHPPAVWRSSGWETASTSTGTVTCTTRRGTRPPRLTPPRWTRSWARSSTSSVTKQGRSPRTLWPSTSVPSTVDRTVRFRTSFASYFLYW